MTVKEIVDILDENRIGYTVLDDPEYDPIEVIFFLEAVPGNLQGKDRRISFADEEGKNRIIVLLTYKEAGLAGWYQKVCKTDGKPGSDDITFLWLHVAYCISNRDCWLRKNIISRHMTKFNVDEKATEEFFADYTLKNGFKIGRINNTVYSGLIGNCISGTAKVRVKLCKKMGLLKMRSYYKYKYYKVGRDKKRRSEEFISGLIRDNIITDHLDDHGRDSFNSNSGGVFFTYGNGDRKFFIKGNEPEPLKTIKNEAAVQQRIIDSNEDKDKFVLMTRCAVDGSWIEFPYVPCKTLDEYLKDHSPDRDSIDMLGRFLCACTDSLYKMNIVHGDLREANIMVVTDESERVTDFLLIDFGASSMDGRLPWDVSYYEGQYMIKNVCGDYRFNEFIIDDAASALLMYLNVGGAAGDEAARMLRSNVGRLYYSIENKEL